jgi:hypothetical protein
LPGLQDERAQLVQQAVHIRRGYWYGAFSGSIPVCFVTLSSHFPAMPLENCGNAGYCQVTDKSAGYIREFRVGRPGGLCCGLWYNRVNHGLAL